MMQKIHLYDKILFPLVTEKSTNKNVEIMNCFDRFTGKNVFELKRNGLLLSVIREKTNESNWN